MIDLRYVKKLVELLDGSSVDSIEISTDKGMKIRISKTPQQRGTVQVAAPVAMPAMMPQQPSMPDARLTPTGGMQAIEQETPRPEPPRPKLLEIRSPMVGTFYKSPEPGAKAYISVGDRIAKGQIVCIIEAMKIMNEIESDFDGVVREVLADDSHPVEYGQVLYRVDPNG